MNGLKPPVFIDCDVQVLTASLVEEYERLTGRVLYPAQLEQLLINLLAYAEMRTRLAIQHAAEQELVPFATGDILEAHGARVGVARMQATPALCTFRVTLRAVESGERLVLKGTPVPAKGGFLFELADDLRIPAGTLYGFVKGWARLSGVAGNGYLPGEVSVPDPLPNIAKIENTDITQGGAETEDDEHLRQRILEAPEGFTTCGSRGAYRYRTLAAHPDVVDVAVLSPGGLKVQIFPLLKTGIPGQVLLDLIQEALSSETVRPLCDVVEVIAPARVPYVLEATVHYRPGTDVAALQALIRANAEAWTQDRRATLGRDLVPSRIIAALWAEGCHEVVVSSPAMTSVGPTEWADCSAINLHYVEAASV